MSVIQAVHKIGIQFPYLYIKKTKKPGYVPHVGIYPLQQFYNTRFVFFLSKTFFVKQTFHQQSFVKLLLAPPEFSMSSVEPLTTRV